MKKPEAGGFAHAPGEDIKVLAQAFEVFTQSTQALEESHRLLEVRARELSEELAAKNQELALTNDYLNCILESMSDGVIAVDPRGIIVTFNRSARVVLGHTSERAVGRVFEDLFGRPFLAGPGVMAVLRNATGRHVRVSERDAPISDRAGRCIGHVKVFQDLTEIHALREQVRQIDRLAAIGEMAATVAHEIRNPLGGIRGFAALLARDIPEEDPRSRLVGKILAGVKNLERVVNELLAYTRPVELQIAPVKCAELVDGALAFLETGGRPVSVRKRLGRDLAVLADADKMRQALLNILINAVQSIEGEGLITISTRAERKHVTIAVADTGCGIAAEQLNKVFSPFYSTKEKGSGLGLAVAAKIVEGHRGRIDAESKPGQGSVFRIRLPRTEHG